MIYRIANQNSQKSNGLAMQAAFNSNEVATRRDASE